MTDRYAVVGNPVQHSRSPEIHRAFAAATGEALTYERLLAPLDGFAETIDAFAGAGGCGCNVTLPFKEQAYRYAGRHTERAQRAGTVNTLKFERGGVARDSTDSGHRSVARDSTDSKHSEAWGDHARGSGRASVLGDNTDGSGLVADIEQNLGVPIAGARILLLGAGGAARAVIPTLLDRGPSQITIFNRTPDRAVTLAGAFPAGTRACEALTAGDVFDIVINATAASLSGEALVLPDGLLSRTTLVYDMVYGQPGTPFLQRARREGAPVIADGLGMLVEQAAESFYLWRGVRPVTAPVLAALRGP